ncbi:MAG: LysM peptidoglycan-binding domain-containing protein [Anaerolineaceae bacterium]|nr:LysM peptidoglycan-binding domain-containing protein [Anaerolineaceae bacterium]MBN2678039.1 LysM peptidoglycan-binding domain-containing protein [Anaerolineaceae bacterium]
MISLLLALFLVMVQSPASSEVKAQSVPFNAYDLIGAVNALRAEYGLPDFNIDGSLMASAQAHSEYQASIQTMTHYGPGGNTANERALAAGYSGRVSENIAVFTLGFQDVMMWLIYDAWADEAHMNTMINPQYQDVGAGVVIGNNRVYITMDAGWPSGTYPLPTRQTWTPEGGPTPGIDPSLVFEPIIISTPLPDGSLYHVIGYGQSLIGIAGAYGLSVTDLATINQINPDQIYAGQKLLIRQAATPSATVKPSATVAAATATMEDFATATMEIPLSDEVPATRVSGIIIIAICVLAAIILLSVNRR